MLVHGLLRLFFGVGGKRIQRYFFESFNFGNAGLEIGELPMAVGSPIGPIDQHDSVVIRWNVAGQVDRAMTERLPAQRGKIVTGIELMHSAPPVSVAQS
jgi:hypothetical protein